MITTSKIAEKLGDPEYRKAFVASQINVGIPFQIRSLMKARGWTQAQLVEKTNMLQPRISGLMTPGRTRPNIETLRRMAEAFDCGLLVRFAPFSELAKWSDDFDPESFNVPSFCDDPGFIERPGPQQERSFSYKYPKFERAVVNLLPRNVPVRLEASSSVASEAQGTTLYTISNTWSLEDVR